MTYLQKVERKPAEGEEEDDDNHHFDHLSKKSESGVNINPVTHIRIPVHILESPFIYQNFIERREEKVAVVLKTKMTINRTSNGTEFTAICAGNAFSISDRWKLMEQ